MTTAQMLILGILGVALVLFAWGRWRHDLVAMATLLLAVLVGIVPAEQAFSGFGHIAVVTVAAVLIISHALQNAGVVGLIAEPLQKVTLSPVLLLFILTGLVTVLSAFMNNVGALALLMPVAMVAARQYQLSPAMLLMPMAFGSLLGGMATLIGTPPNIVLSGYRADELGAGYNMFDFAPVGATLAVIGVVFLSLLGWRFIPKARLQYQENANSFKLDAYLTEVRLKPESPLLGKTVASVALLNQGALHLIGIANANGLFHPAPEHRLQAQDILLLKGDPHDVRAFLEQYDGELLTADAMVQQPGQHLATIQEAIVSDDSPLIGQSVDSLKQLSANNLTLLGLARRAMPVNRLRAQQFQADDVLLVLGHEDTIRLTLSKLKLLPLVKRPFGLNRRRNPWLALAIFVGAIGLGISNLVSLPIAFILAIMAYVLLGHLRVRELYEQVDWPIIVLLGAMLPVGAALETTGATQVLVSNLLSALGTVSPVVLLTLLLIITTLLSAIINNTAAALVMAPIGMGIANQVGVSPDAFLMAISVGASAAFLTPIGHQSNLLVMSPGGYQFGDYWRVGLPLTLLLIVLAVPLLLWFWPL